MTPDRHSTSELRFEESRSRSQDTDMRPDLAQCGCDPISGMKA
ncbi:MAG: hypothetical protein PHY05_07265 [Methanothrix sp.]|nr:hypothetical protein [Methanothrix sp.]